MVDDQSTNHLNIKQIFQYYMGDPLDIALKSAKTSTYGTKIWSGTIRVRRERGEEEGILSEMTCWMNRYHTVC
jgi:hypothetical protein